ncbi:TPA: phospho-N-acetylmuramoyl-pentapeptide-transferase [bacterium]|nr:phospho-N-acetylmuramoyl-pentapeptide-transferase [bacterium]
MFYWLFYEVLYEYFSFLRVFKYITFRAAYSALFSLIIAFIIIPYFVKILKQKRITERVKKPYLENHIHKEVTPTMGGISILFIILLSTILWARLDNRAIILILLVVMGFFILGFIDDYLKIKTEKTSGLLIRYKLLGQIGIGILVGVYLYLYPLSLNQTVITFPFTKGVSLDISWFYIIFCIFVVVASSNAVNLTDGLDGLAIGSLIFVGLGLIIMTYLAGHKELAQYLKIDYVPLSSELVIFLSSLLGASLGFLWFNSHPAQIFMGDCGSLALGGALGTIALIIKQEVALIIVGGLFVIEVGSSLIQIIFYKMTGKRIFLMSPLHHHFEKKGWTESKIVIRFWIIAIIFVLLSLSTLKLR